MAGIKLSPKQAIQLAIEEAKKGLGYVEPNPPVGCVILDCNYRLLSSGYHAKYGGNHAEVAALNKIRNKKKLKNGHVFITLEPCHHKGKTPSCAKQLSCFGFQSITYGASDPFTKKRGVNFLIKKGIKVIRSIWFQNELIDLVSAFTFSYIYQRSFISLKVATSLDGIISLNHKCSNHSKFEQWITSVKARRHARFLRATHSAILIGADTLIKDNPRLNVRLPYYTQKKNKVIILDINGRTLNFLSGSRLIKTHSPDNIFIFCAPGVQIPKGAEKLAQIRFFRYFFSPKSIKPITAKNSYNKEKVFNLSALLKKLYQEESIQSIVVEGGGFCISQFLNQQVAQKIYLYIAPRILGSGLRWSEYLSIKALPNRLFIDKLKLHSIQPDFMLEGYLNFANKKR